MKIKVLQIRKLPPWYLGLILLVGAVMAAGEKKIITLTQMNNVNFTMAEMARYPNWYANATQIIMLTNSFLIGFKPCLM